MTEAYLTCLCVVLSVGFPCKGCQWLLQHFDGKCRRMTSEISPLYSYEGHQKRNLKCCCGFPDPPRTEPLVDLCEPDLSSVRAEQWSGSSVCLPAPWLLLWLGWTTSLDYIKFSFITPPGTFSIALSLLESSLIESHFIFLVSVSISCSQNNEPTLENSQSIDFTQHCNCYTAFCFRNVGMLREFLGVCVCVVCVRERESMFFLFHGKSSISRLLLSNYSK